MVNVGKWELDDLIDVKKMREDKALAFLNAQKKKLAAEQGKLLNLQNIAKQAERNVYAQIQLSYEEKRKGTTSFKVDARKHHIEVLKNEHKKKLGDVEKQKGAVTNAEKEVEKARVSYGEAAKESNKLKEFRKEWEKNKKTEILEGEENEMDEIGTLLFQHNSSLNNE